MLGRLFGRKQGRGKVEQSAPEAADDETDDETDDVTDDDDDDDDYPDSQEERVARCRQILTGYMQELGGSVVDLHADNYYQRSIELRFRHQGAAARVQTKPFTGEIEIHRKGTFRCAGLYVYLRGDGEKLATPPLIPDEWDDPDPAVEHALSDELYISATRSTIEDERALVASLPAGWLDRLAGPMRRYGLRVVYFNDDRMGADRRDDDFETPPPSAADVAAVLDLLAELAKPLSAL